MTIQESVARKIENCGEIVINTVVDKLADIEIQKRIELITKALSKKELLEKENKKSHKADIVEYDQNGTLTKEAFSKSKVDTIKKDKEKLSGLINILNKCLESNLQEDYNKLKEILDKLNNAGGNKSESSTEA